MSLELTSAPSTEPITTAEAKSHARITTSDDDTEIDALIAQAREWVESYLSRALITQTWKLRLDDGLHDMVIPKGPLQSVSSISYIDENGDSQTLSSAVYSVDTYKLNGEVTLAYDQTWPSTRAIPNNVTVTFIAGYGNAGSDVPEPIRLAIMQLVAHWYEHKEPIVVGTIVGQIPLSVERLLAPYRINFF